MNKDPRSVFFRRICSTFYSSLPLEMKGGCYVNSSVLFLYKDLFNANPIFVCEPDEIYPIVQAF